MVRTAEGTQVSAQGIGARGKRIKLVGVLVFAALLGQCAWTPTGLLVPVSGDSALAIDAGAASLYVDLLWYIRSVHLDELDLPEGALTQAQIGERIEANRADPELIARIDALLDHPAYTELASVMRSSKLGIRGKNAYRETFIRIPWERTVLRGGVDEQILDVLRGLDQDTRDSVQAVIDALCTPEAAQRIFDTTDAWLPEDVEHRSTYQVYVYFDGNRGGFQTEHAIYLDLMHHRSTLEEAEGLQAMEQVISHELHHTAYTDWLKSNARDFAIPPLLGPRRTALGLWQMDLVLEGTAQFCDYGRKPEVVRAMQFDPDMNTVMFGVYQDTFLAMARGEMGLIEYQQIREDYSYDVSRDLFLEYLALTYTEEEIAAIREEDPSFLGYRPVPHYFVGYRIFWEIHQAQGIEGFLAAATHPFELMERYHAVAVLDPSLPQISEEFVEAWREL